MKKQIWIDTLFFLICSLGALAYLVSPESEAEQLHWFQRWDFFLGILAGSVVLAFGVAQSSWQTLGALTNKPKLDSKPAGLRLWLVQLLILISLILYFGTQQSQISMRELFDSQGLRGAGHLFSELLNPNLSLLPRAFLNVLQTVFVALMATLLALPIAFLLGFVAAKNMMTSKIGFLIYAALRTFLNLIRSVEALIWAIIFTSWVGIGPFAGMLALMVHSIASLTKQFSEIIENASVGPVEAIRSTGASQIQVLWFGVLPQVFLPFVSYAIYRWDTNVRMATIVGLVGGGGIGTMLMKYQGQAMWREVGCIILVIALVVWLMDTASAYLREALK